MDTYNKNCFALSNQLTMLDKPDYIHRKIVGRPLLAKRLCNINYFLIHLHTALIFHTWFIQIKYTSKQMLSAID